MEKFLNLLVEDEKIREQFLLQRTPEGAYRIAKPYLDDMTSDEFKDSLAGLIESFESDDDSKKIVDDKELGDVSGGKAAEYIINNMEDYINKDLKEALSVTFDFAKQ